MKITIIGAGNMGGAFALGLAAGKLVDASDITVSNPSQAKLDALTANYPLINVTHNNAEAVKSADFVLLAVKPWLVESVINEIKPSLDYSHQIFGSVAAGIGTERLASLLDKGDGVVPPIFYIIPNTAMTVASSMTFVASAGASGEQQQTVINLFNEVGSTLILEERLMGAATALSSCGIAFAMRYVRAASEAGVELGFYASQAQKIVEQTVRGAVDLLSATGNCPEVEIDKVTTPGGVTIKGLNEMEHAGFTSSVIRGVKAAYNKK